MSHRENGSFRFLCALCASAACLDFGVRLWYESRIFDARRRRFVPEVAQVWEDGSGSRPMPQRTVVVSSPKGRPKVFFFFLNGDGQSRFCCEHPVLQGGFQTRPSQQSPDGLAGRQHHRRRPLRRPAPAAGR